MMKFIPKPKRPKALWYRALHGDKPAPKARVRIRPMSAKMRKERAHDRAEVEEWMRGKSCAACGLVDAMGELICRDRKHNAHDRHHTRGRSGPMLHDKRFWMPLCRRAHDWVKNNPLSAKALGLIDEGPWNHAPKEDK